MDRDSRFLLRKIVIDFVVLLTVGIPILLFYLFGKPYHRGFFCNDESIMHPFKESTVSNTALYIVGLFLPITVIVVTEVFIHRSSAGHKSHTFMGHVIPSWVWNSYKVIGVFGFGAASSQLTTDIAKYMIGRLRPHFIDVCKPNINCSDVANQYKYFEDYECTANLGTRKLKSTRLSFPSGHSSFSAYTMLFVVCYLQSRMTFRGSKLLKHALQYICLMFSWATAMSRISDYKHHWSDVLCGLLIGCIVAILTVVYVSDLFPRKSLDDESEPLRSKISPSNRKNKYTSNRDYQSTEGHETEIQNPLPLTTISDGRNASPRANVRKSPSAERLSGTEGHGF